MKGYVKNQADRESLILHGTGTSNQPHTFTFMKQALVQTCGIWQVLASDNYFRLISNDELVATNVTFKFNLFSVSLENTRLKITTRDIHAIDAKVQLTLSEKNGLV